ncbi:MAG: ABC transporter permease [Candidatus Aminicenantes bacterium]|jgi:hypothetical protein
MLKKEISDVLKQIAIFTVYLFALPAFLVFTKIIVPELHPYFSVFFPIFQFSLLFGAFFMGASLFSVERGQRGMEYLLSLPFSRYQVVGIKILPRFAAVLLFYAVFVILYTSGGEDLVALPFFSFSFLYFSLYLISLALSASSENFIVLFVSSVFSLFIYLNLVPIVFWLVALSRNVPLNFLDLRLFFTANWDPEISVLGFFSAFILLLPLLVCFGLSIKKLDIRPARVYNKRFFKLLAPIFLGGFIFSFLFANWSVGVKYSYYYLTEDLKLIESTPYSGIKIYDGDKVHKVKGDFGFYWPSPFYEENEYVYDSIRNKIVRMNMSDYTVDVLYEAPPEKYFRGPVLKFEQTFAFQESIYHRKEHRLETKLVLLDEPSRNFTKISLNVEPLKNHYQQTIFGAVRTNDQRYWLLTTWSSKEERHIFKLWEDGKIEHIGKSQKWPFYINGMLLTYSEDELIIHQEKEGKYVPIQRIPNPEGYRFGLSYYFRTKLDDFPTNFLYGTKRITLENQRIGTSYAILDLENFKIEGIGKAKGRLDYYYPDNLYFIESDPVEPEIRIYKYMDGQVKLFKTFEDFDYKKPENRTFWCRSGIVLRRGKKVKVYAYPDLKEIKFKKL